MAPLLGEVFARPRDPELGGDEGSALHRLGTLMAIRGCRWRVACCRRSWRRGRRGPSERTPIHLLSGGADPVGEFGRGIERFAGQLRRAERRLVSYKLYPEARHEIINETNADEVWEDIRALVLHGRLSDAPEHSN